MLKKIIGVLLISSTMCWGSAAVPRIVVSQTQVVAAATSGGFVLYTTPGADGNYRLSVYVERGSGAGQICISPSWSDDYNSNGFNICNAVGSAYVEKTTTFHALAGTDIGIYVMSDISTSGKAFLTLEEI